MKWTWLTPVMRLLFWVWVGSGAYYAWSRLYRAVFERRWRGLPIAGYASPQDLTTALSFMDWTPDPLGGLVDVISRPERVEARLQEIWEEERADPEPDENEDLRARYARAMTLRRVTVGDCDDFAVYAAAVISKMSQESDRWSWREPALLTVAWYDVQGKWRAHAVCLFFDRDIGHYGHVGNWGRGTPFFVRDTGGRDLAALRRLIEQTIVRGGRLVAWAVGDWELRGRPRILVCRSQEG